MGPESVNHMCNNDQFIVSGATNSVPAICGINHGNHSKSISFYHGNKITYWLGKKFISSTSVTFVVDVLFSE